jgi:tetratricopeptide (TPR) repeat protein/Mg-chelatase subunit ChlD
MQARLELAAGEVTLEQGGNGGPGLSGVALLPEATVKTGSGARALVRLSDGSALFLRGGSAVRLGAERIELKSGEVWLDAPPAERTGMVHQLGEITVFAADAGLSMKRTETGGVVYVARGTATVSAPGGRSEVQAGMQAQVEGKSAPALSPVAFWEDWTGGMADHRVVGSLAGAGSGQIFGVDYGAPPGTPAGTLEIARQSVRAVLRGGLAETEVDQTFFNPADRPVEGWYWFTVPEDASVTGFALDTNGVLVEGEFIERREAAAQYGRAVSTGHEPALLEWINPRTFRARIYPVPAAGTRRVVLRYLQLLPQSRGTLRYLYPLQSDKPVRIGEFSLSVDLGAEGRDMELTTLADARVEDGGRRVTMRRSGYVPRADFLLEARLRSDPPPVRIARFPGGGEAADYLLVRYVPDFDFGKVKAPRGEVVVVVDTSAGGDENSRALKSSAAEAILRALSADDTFALVSLDVRPTVLHPAEGLAAANPAEIGKALEKLAEHSTGGATDLASFFDVALSRLHGGAQPAVIYVGDGVPTSGETGGEALIERLRRALSTSRARLFTVGVGPHANRGLLQALARTGGGQAFQVDDAEAASERALRLVAALKTPTITDFEVDLGASLDELYESANGKVGDGQEVVFLARSHQELPQVVKVKGRLGGEAIAREYRVTPDRGISTAFVPRLWAAEQMTRLLGSAVDPEGLRGKIMQLGIEYGLMTPYTSILALESEQAYRQQGIPRRASALRGVRLSSLDLHQETTLAAELAQTAGAVLGYGCSKSEPGASAPNPVGAAESKRKVGMEQAPVPSPPMRAPEEQAAKQMASADEGGPDSVGAGSLASLSNMAKDDGDVPRPAEIKERPRPAVVPPNKKAGGARHQPAPAKPAIAPAPPAQSRDARLGQALQTCSDAAARPLWERVILWQKRLRTANGPQELIGRYLAARQSCELNDWRSEANFLYMLQYRINDEGSASMVLSFFRGEPEVQVYLARLILRRTVDPRLIAVVESVLFGDQVNWANVDNELSALKSPIARLEKLRQIMVRSPNDPNGLLRLVRLLIANNQLDDALLQGRRLRDSGLATPFVSRELGDVLARQKLDDEAVRTYSEIVEFDPDSLPSRRLLGDIYLAHGWYDPAYRQYKVLTEAAPQDTSAWLRLAAAAAGAGRVDEALRLERQVASSPGRPGPDDARRWAELWSAARLARLLQAPPKEVASAGAGLLESLKNKLKELQLFRGPGTLVLVTWEDLGADLQLATLKGETQETIGQATDGAPVGLSAVLLSPGEVDQVTLRAFLRSTKKDAPLKLTRQDIRWDGKAFQVEVKDLSLPEGQNRLDL